MVILNELKNIYRNSETLYQAEGQSDQQQRYTNGKQAGCHLKSISSLQLNASYESLFIYLLCMETRLSRRLKSRDFFISQIFFSNNLRLLSYLFTVRLVERSEQHHVVVSPLCLSHYVCSPEDSYRYAGSVLFFIIMGTFEFNPIQDVDIKS